MRKLFVNAKDFTSKDEMHAAMRAVLGEENYFGSNLDALHDCLSSISEPTELRIVNWSFAARHLGEYADRLWRVLSDSTDEDPNLNITIE
ncbi:MAG: barstar family protein [Clostridiales bacterium]|nr:barstar family protein [Clostridiales bacterium]